MPNRALLAATAVAAATLVAAVTLRADPNRYHYSDRVEKHMLPAVSTGPLDPAWSPDGRWIAFSMRGDIWKVPAAGGQAIALTQGPAYYFEPAWSPDGKRVAFSMDTNGNLDIGIVGADGGDVDRITADSDVDVEPAWSRDGGSVYFVSGRGRQRGERFTIYRHDLGANTNAPVAEGIQPALSPNGKELAYVAPVRGRLGSGGLWVRSLADSAAQPTLVQYDETEYRMKPAWTPDGTALYYVSDDAGSNDIMVVPAEGGNPERLTIDDHDEYAPRPSPDGSRIAFVSNRTGPTTLYIANAGGGRQSSWHAVSITSRRPRVATGHIRVRVLDEHGTPTPARVYIAASDGRSYAPDGGFQRVMSATETHYFETTGEFDAQVPAGRTQVEVVRGPEYRPRTVSLDVAAGGTVRATVRLTRLVDLPSLGWYSGDTHIHDLHQGRFGLTHQGFFDELRAEDLHMTWALIHMDGTRIMGRWSDLTGRPSPLSTRDYILQYAEEFRGSLGHMELLGISRFVLPLTAGVRGTAYAEPVLDQTYIDSAHAQGGIAGFPHPYYLPPTTPARAASTLIPVDVALGKGDYYDVASLWSDEIGSTELYYRLLNCGFRLPATAGTDNFSDVWRDPPPGSDRTYVHIKGRLTTASWIKGLEAQHTFATTGPLVMLQVQGREPGDAIALNASAPRTLKVRATAQSIAPMEKLDIIVNGAVAATVTASTDSSRLAFDDTVAVPAGGWVAARVIGPKSRYVGDDYAFAQTSPVYVVRGGRRFTSPNDAKFLSESITALEQRVEGAPWRTRAEHDTFMASLEKAKAVYDAIASGSATRGQPAR